MISQAAKDFPLDGPWPDEGVKVFMEFCASAYERYHMDASPDSTNMMLAAVMGEAYIRMRNFEGELKVRRYKEELLASSWLTRWLNRTLLKSL